MTSELLPSEREILHWLRQTIKHVYNVEYFLCRLDIGEGDPQRPHDIVGEGNKFEWEVIKGLSLQYRNSDKDFFKKYIKPAIDRHEIQYHHIKFNQPNPEATDDDMKLGAVDAICSRREPDREYQGGQHTYEQIEEIIHSNPPHKIPWLKMMLPKMKTMHQPDLEVLSNLDNIPNIGIPIEMNDAILARIQETFNMLRVDHGYNI